MTGGAAERLAAWSVGAYARMLVVYPYPFRREFEESMIQVFRDLARDACHQRGLAGLAALWARTAADLAESVVDEYVSERRKAMGRAVAAAGVLYVCALALVTGYGAVRFAEFYDPPGFSRDGAGEAVGEDTLMAAYEQALAGEFGSYKSFVRGAGLALAALLGVASALVGLWRRSLVLGGAALAAGAVLTVGAVSLLPTMWYPMDRYPAGFGWLLGCFPLAAAAWLAATAALPATRPGA